MNANRLLVGLLTVAQLTGAAALISTAFAVDAKMPDPFAYVIVGAALGQLGLLAAWLVWGRMNAALRLGSLLGSVLVWLYPIAKLMRDENQSLACGGQLLIYSLIVAAILGLVRLSGLKLAHEEDAVTPTVKRGRSQFTLGGLLTFTAIIGMLLAIGLRLDFFWDELLPNLPICLGIAIAAVACLVAVLRMPTFWAAFVIPLSFVVAAGFLIRYTNWPPPAYDALAPRIALFGALGTLTIVAVGVLRVAGYRLVGWRRSKARVATDV